MSQSSSLRASQSSSLQNLHSVSNTTQSAPPPSFIHLLHQSVPLVSGSISMTAKQQSVELDMPDESPGLSKENGLTLQPVAAGASGVGFPYAPVDFPNPGDVWRWKVGKRKSKAGFMADRYLYPPHRIRSLVKSIPFASLQSVREFLQTEFPDVDTEAFLSSFSWKIPSKDHPWDPAELPTIYPMYEMAAHSGSELDVGDMKCKARNKMCNLELEEETSSLPTIDCDICCSEARFCRNCCCMLCTRSIDWAHGGYSFIRCAANLNEGYICGHAGHIECALRSYMAGTVGGTIGLDAEYYCRRCDHRTDIVPHVEKFLKNCESLDSRDDIEKILKLGICILRGSEQENAKRLLIRVNVVFTKLKNGNDLEEIWNMEDNASMVSAGATPHLFNNGNSSDMEATNYTSAHGFNNIQKRHEEPVYIATDHQIESLKLEDEIDQVLQDLKRSQELEYRMAEERLYAQKDLLTKLYQQLDAERLELAKRTASTMECDMDTLLTSISNRVNQIKHEVARFKDMQEVAKGFGRTSKGILNEHFGFEIDD